MMSPSSHLAAKNPDLLKQVILAWLLLMAFCFPLSIAAASLTFFPFIAIYLLAGLWTFRLWPPTWGNIETSFAVFFGISLMSALTGADPWHSRIRLEKDLYVVLIVALGAIVRKNPTEGRKWLRVFLWGGLITAAFGILQYAGGISRTESTTPLLNVPGLLSHAPQAFLNKLSLIDGRATGLRGHPLTFAETLLFPLAYTLSLLAIGPKKSWWKAAVAQGVLLLALLFSQSRGPWLAFAVMTVVILALEPRAYLLQRLMAVMIPIALVICAPSLKHRVSTIGDPGHGSNAERLQMWRVGAHIVKDHPLLGVGPGNVKIVSAQYQTPAEHAAYGDWGHLHNTYINFVVERGLLGLIAFLGFIGCMGWTLFQAHRTLPEDNYDGRLLVLTAFLGLLGWLVSGMTETVYNDTSILMMFYFVMGVALAYCKT